jgi:hypothetical protein
MFRKIADRSLSRSIALVSGRTGARDHRPLEGKIKGAALPRRVPLALQGAHAVPVGRVACHRIAKFPQFQWPRRHWAIS